MAATSPPATVTSGQGFPSPAGGMGSPLNFIGVVRARQ